MGEAACRLWNMKNLSTKCDKDLELWRESHKERQKYDRLMSNKWKDKFCSFVSIKWYLEIAVLSSTE